jgi:hypothetical protein
MQTTAARLTYSIGNEHNPVDPFGRSELVVEPTGSARLDHSSRGGHRAWTGRIEPAALARLWAALEQAGFPSVPAQSVPPDAPLCTLVVEAGGTRQAALVAWHAAPDLPGYAEAIMILDSIVWHLSEGTVGRSPAAPVSVVSDIQRVS